uniref:Uncharacterized protein n=1 Tax=Cacopsylla melanoneura TaxID=428564 RepID=A0A8D8ZE06_9HEMI
MFLVSYHTQGILFVDRSYTYNTVPIFYLVFFSLSLQGIFYKMFFTFQVKVQRDLTSLPSHPLKLSVHFLLSCRWLRIIQILGIKFLHVSSHVVETRNLCIPKLNERLSIGF